MESPWIDIGAELVHAASEGLSLIEWLSSWAKVDVVSNVLVCITTMPLDYHEYPQGDDLEYCAAVALRNVDELLRQQSILAQRWNRRAQAPTLLPPPAVTVLKVLQRHMQDVVLLACARFIDQTILEGQGIPAELQDRLNVAFRTTVHADIPLWTRLGNSKSHVFTPGVTRSLGRGGGLGRRGGRKRATMRARSMGLDDEASEAVARDPLVSSSAAPSDLAAGAPTAVESPSSVDLVQPPVCSLAAGREFSAPPGLPLPPPTPLVHSAASVADEFCEIDIAAELTRVASEGLHTVTTAIRHDESLQVCLAYVKETLVVLKITPAYCHSQWRDDDLELRAATALVEVDGVLRQHTHDSFTHLQLQLLQQHLQDLVVLSCSRFISNTILQSKGIPSELLVRLDAAFWATAMEGGYRRDDLVSNLQECKDYVFGPSARFQ